MSLPAVILVGGEGTRLRPLTERVPKPMLPLLDRPLLEYTLDHLRTADVDLSLLACGYLPTEIARHFGYAYNGMALDYRVEPMPLGTAGAIAYAARGIGETFLALNGDSLREADLNRLVAFHRSSGAKATILLTHVPDPGRFGLVRTAPDGRVREFVEKPDPDAIDTDTINAGVYVLEPEVLDLVPRERPVSIERTVFPELAREGSLFALALPGYWLDIGTPASYLQAHLDLLGRDPKMSIAEGAEVAGEVELIPPVRIEPEARVSAGSRIGPFVHLGRGAYVGRRAVARWTAVLPRAEVAEDAHVVRSIVAPGIGAVLA
jgi:mannose-1-phosphate guanylyltransferase